MAAVFCAPVFAGRHSSKSSPDATSSVHHHPPGADAANIQPFVCSESGLSSITFMGGGPEGTQFTVNLNGSQNEDSVGFELQNVDGIAITTSTSISFNYIPSATSQNLIIAIDGKTSAGHYGFGVNLPSQPTGGHSFSVTKVRGKLLRANFLVGAMLNDLHKLPATFTSDQIIAFTENVHGHPGSVHVGPVFLNGLALGGNPLVAPCPKK